MFDTKQGIYLFLLMLAISINTGLGQEASEGKCTCGLFGNETHLDEPIIKHGLPFSVPCDEQGALNCSNTCFAMVETVPEAAKEEFLCKILNRNINIPQVVLCAKSCGKNTWVSTGHKSSKSICCRKGNSVPCN